MRIISASLTTDQIIASVNCVTRGEPPIKDVTRRLGWEYVEPGERLQVVKKAMGRKPGEPLEKLAVVEVVSRRREVLRTMLLGGSHNAYGREECRREGFRPMSDEEMEAHDKLDGIIGPRRAINGDPKMFVRFFCATHKVKIPGTKRYRQCEPADPVTRIEFKYIIPITIVAATYKTFDNWVQYQPIARQYLRHIARAEQAVGLRPNGVDTAVNYINLDAPDETRHMLFQRGFRPNGESIKWQPLPENGIRCCERDHDGDGNCDRHPRT